MNISGFSLWLRRGKSAWTLDPLLPALPCRRHIGVVPQDVLLFNESLGFNLRYGSPNATDEQVKVSCTEGSAPHVFCPLSLVTNSLTDSSATQLSLNHFVYGRRSVW